MVPLKASMLAPDGSLWERNVLSWERSWRCILNNEHPPRPAFSWGFLGIWGFLPFLFPSSFTGGSGKTDPVRFRRGSEEGLLKDDFTCFWGRCILTSYTWEEKSCLQNAHFLQSKRALSETPVQSGPGQFFPVLKKATHAILYGRSWGCRGGDWPYRNKHTQICTPSLGTWALWLRNFRNPCDRDPPTRNFKNFKFFKNSLKYLTFTFGERASTFGERASTFWGLSGFSGFLEFLFFVAGGFWGSVGRGAP